MSIGGRGFVFDLPNTRTTVGQPVSDRGCLPSHEDLALSRIATISRRTCLAGNTEVLSHLTEFESSPLALIGGKPESEVLSGFLPFCGCAAWFCGGSQNLSGVSLAKTTSRSIVTALIDVLGNATMCLLHCRTRPRTPADEVGFLSAGYHPHIRYRELVHLIKKAGRS